MRTFRRLLSSRVFVYHNPVLEGSLNSGGSTTHRLKAVVGDSRKEIVMPDTAGNQACEGVSAELWTTDCLVLIE